MRSFVKSNSTERQIAFKEIRTIHTARRSYLFEDLIPVKNIRFGQQIGVKGTEG